jgi:hypothetical protein
MEKDDDEEGKRREEKKRKKNVSRQLLMRMMSRFCCWMAMCTSFLISTGSLFGLMICEWVDLEFL